jgi:hypothetical protein
LVAGALGVAAGVLLGPVPYWRVPAPEQLAPVVQQEAAQWTPPPVAVSRVAAEPIASPPPKAPEQPAPSSVLLAFPLRTLDVPWDEVERTLRLSALATTPAELQVLCDSTGDGWKVLCDERAFLERVREVQQEAPVGNWSARAQWHQVRFSPWLTENLVLFVDQLYRHRVPAEMVDRFRNRMLEHL